MGPGPRWLQDWLDRRGERGDEELKGLSGEDETEGADVDDNPLRLVEQFSFGQFQRKALCRTIRVLGATFLRESENSAGALARAAKFRPSKYESVWKTVSILSRCVRQNAEISA